MVRQRLAYRPALDGLRAIAVLAVVADHGWTAILPGGWAGVDIFFVLSGFLITTLLLEEFAGGGRVDLRAFYVRRVRRLGPALLVVVAVTLALGRATLWQAGMVLTDRANLVVWPWQHLGPLAQTWSLSMEEQFYFAWPLLLCAVLAWRRSVRPLLVLGLLGIAATVLARFLLYGAGAGPDALYFRPWTHGPDALLIGCVAAMAVRGRPSRTLTVAAAAVLAALLLLLNGDTASQLVLGLTAVPLASAVLVVHAARSRSPLSWGPLVWIGKRSYSLYLWHYAVNASLTSMGWRHGPALLLATLAGGLVAADLSYRYVEQPLRRRRTTGAQAPDGAETWPSVSAPSAAA